MRLLVLSLLAGCAPESDGSLPAPPVVPSAWTWDEPVRRGPPLTAAQVEAELPDVLAELAGFHGADVIALYRSRVELHDPPCPYVESTVQTGSETVLSDYWSGDGCTTDDGAYIDGYAYSRETFGRTLDDGLTYDGFDFKGEGVVIDPDGATFMAGGFAFLMEGLSRDGRSRGWQSGVQGSVTWTGEGYDSAWFTGERVAEMVVEAYELEGRRSLRAEGGVAGFSGLIQGFVAWPVALYEASACPQELGGDLWLRDVDGRWYALAFDGATSLDDALDLDACDGCGRLSLNGEALGEVCASPEALTSWGDTPW